MANLPQDPDYVNRAIAPGFEGITDSPTSLTRDFLDTGCMTTAQLLVEYQISRPTLDGLVREGLPAINVGTGRKRSLRFNRAAVAAWLRNRR